MGSPADPQATLDVRVYPPAWRLVAAVLFAFSRASLPAMLVAILVARNPPVTPPALFRSLALFAVLPGVAAWLIGRTMAARVTVGNGRMVVGGTEIRPSSVIPWHVPLPGPGLSLVVGAERHGVQARDPLPVYEMLTGSRAAHPTLVYAHARAAAGAWRWWMLVGKFVVFGLAPTAVLFNAHQHIAFGGTFGQYYLVGPTAYLTTFALYWTTVVIQLVLYASVWRGLGEGIALAAAWVAPSQAARVRHGVEIACRVLYYGGVPALLALRFAPW